jgi:hypothetical protein
VVNEWAADFRRWEQDENESKRLISQSLKNWTDLDT